MSSFAVLSDSCKAMLALSPSPRSRVSLSRGSNRGAGGGASTSSAVSLRTRRCPCFAHGSMDMSSTRHAVLALDAKEEVKDLRPSLRARDEQELLSFVRKEAKTGRLSTNVADGLEELFHNYRNAFLGHTAYRRHFRDPENLACILEDQECDADAQVAIFGAETVLIGGYEDKSVSELLYEVLQSGVPGANEIILSNMAVVFDRILLDVEDPYKFSPHHMAIREPFDYYTFAQNYIRPLIDYRNSYVGNISIFNEMEQNLQQGHNIVLISNHQTEADPAIIALLLERTHSHIAEKMVYVAGDRVLTDPLCKPFSMGRNLLCVYSKKHMDDDPELVEMKKKANTRTLKEMALLLRTGSQIIWIAPSGGRDRPDPRTGEWYPAPFDASSVDNMRRVLEYSNVPGHIYPLALQCYEIMPPPPEVEKLIGERRKISFHGAGVSIAPELDYNEITDSCGNPEEAKEAYSQALYNSVTEQYNVLKSAISGYNGFNASNSVVFLSQPWK